MTVKETTPVSALVAPVGSVPAAVMTPVPAAKPEAAAPKALATPKTAPPAPAKLPARKAHSEKAIVKKVPVKKAPLQKIATKGPLSKAMAPAKLETKVPTLPSPNTKKPKLVRDSFTIPKAEYVALDELKLRAAALVRPAKKSELLRAGIKILDSLSDAAYLAALAQVPTIKTGRPAHKK